MASTSDNYPSFISYKTAYNNRSAIKHELTWNSIMELSVVPILRCLESIEMRANRQVKKVQNNECIYKMTTLELT